MDVKKLRGTVTRLAVAAAITLGGGLAKAAPVVSVDIQTVGVEDQYGVESETLDNGDGTFGLTGIGYGANFNCDWSIVINPDPQITSAFTLTNISTSTQSFIMNITLPIAAISSNTVQGGYFGGNGIGTEVDGTQYTDANNSSDVTLATFGGNPFYQALVNSNVVSQSLGSFTLTASGGPGVYGNESQQFWGTPIPSAPFGPASGNIRIRWQFSLTPGDSVSTKGFFQVEAPEPSALLLVGLGLAGLVAARKRARA